MLYRTILAATIFAALAPTAMAGEITRPLATGDFEWKSTTCLRPSRPYLRPGNPQNQALMQAYARQVAVYLDYLKTEAQQDFDRAQFEMQQAVQETLQEETDRMNDEIEQMARQSR